MSKVKLDFGRFLKTFEKFRGKMFSLSIIYIYIGRIKHKQSFGNIYVFEKLKYTVLYVYVYSESGGNLIAKITR